MRDVLSWSFPVGQVFNIAVRVHILLPLVMIGLFTRWAAFLCSGLMAAAYFMAHAFAQVGAMGFVGLAPLNNGGEMSALYFFVFLFIAAHGPGLWSLDNSRS